MSCAVLSVVDIVFPIVTRPTRGDGVRKESDLIAFLLDPRQTSYDGLLPILRPRRLSDSQYHLRTTRTYLTLFSQFVLVSTAVLYALFTGSGTQFNLGGFLEELSPYTFAMVGVALNIGLSVAGAGWSVQREGSGNDDPPPSPSFLPERVGADEGEDVGGSGSRVYLS